MGSVQVSMVDSKSDTETTLVHELPPTVTEVEPTWKLVPVTVRVTPPLVGQLEVTVADKLLSQPVTESIPGATG